MTRLTLRVDYFLLLFAFVRVIKCFLDFDCFRFGRLSACLRLAPDRTRLFESKFLDLLFNYKVFIHTFVDLSTASVDFRQSRFRRFSPSVDSFSRSFECGWSQTRRPFAASDPNVIQLSHLPNQPEPTHSTIQSRRVGIHLETDSRLRHSDLFTQKYTHAPIS